MQVYNDELYHFGKKGMKWGKRTISRIKERANASNQMYKDQFRHPIHSTAAQINLLKNNPKAALNMKTDDIKKLNADVKQRVYNSNTKSDVNRTHDLLKNMGHLMLKARDQYETQKVANEIFR